MLFLVLKDIIEERLVGYVNKDAIRVLDKDGNEIKEVIIDRVMGTITLK